MSGPNSAGELLQLFRTGAVATRGELQRVTGLSRSTVTLRIDALLVAGYLTQDGAIPDLRRGRPSTRLRINDRAITVLAADLGATHGRLAVSTAAGEVIEEMVIEPYMSGCHCQRGSSRRASCIQVESGWKAFR